MLDITFGTALAYNYRYPKNELHLVFKMHEVSGEPGSFRFTACAYRETGAFDRFCYDATVDVYDMYAVYDELVALFNAADECIRTAFVNFDVFYNLTDSASSVWHTFSRVGRRMLAVAFEREGVDLYPLTIADVKELANRLN